MKYEKNLYAFMKEGIVLLEVRGFKELVNASGVVRNEEVVLFYKAKESWDIKVDDDVLVYAEGRKRVYKVSRIGSVMEMKEHLEYKWVIQKVDYFAHNEAVEREENFQKAAVILERKKQVESMREEIMSSLDEDSRKQLTQELEK